jgi:thioredoxin reductase
MVTFKVAIVGAGPAGYFAAQALQNAQSDEYTVKTWLETYISHPLEHASQIKSGL